MKLRKRLEILFFYKNHGVRGRCHNLSFYVISMINFSWHILASYFEDMFGLNKNIHVIFCWQRLKLTVNDVIIVQVEK